MPNEKHLCDDFAVGRTDDPTALAKALSFLQLNSFNKQNLFAMNAVKRNHPFLDRLKRLFGQEEQAEKMKKGRVILPVLVLLLAVFATTAYTEATPEIEGINEIATPPENGGIYDSNGNLINGWSISTCDGDFTLELEHDGGIETTIWRYGEFISGDSNQDLDYWLDRQRESEERSQIYKQELFERIIDTVPLFDESNVWVEKKGERIIVTEKDEEGNERKLIKETLENGEKRVSAFLNGESVEVDENMLAMIPPPPPPAPPTPPRAPHPELYKELTELAQVYAEKKAKGIEDKELLRKLEVLGRLAALESLNLSKNTDPFIGLEALEAIGEFNDIVVIPPMPPFPPMPPIRVNINPDSLPEGIDKEEFERYIEQIEVEAERIEEMAEEFQEKYGRAYEEAIERSMEKQENWIELQEEYSEEKMQEFGRQQEEAAKLFEEQHEIFEKQLHERAHELENLSEQLENRFPQLFMDMDVVHEDLENLFERGGEDHEHEHLEGLDSEDLKELRDNLRKMLADDGLIKGKKKKATIRFLKGEAYSVNGKRMNEKQQEKYHDFFHENDIPHEEGMEIRAYKNVFQVGREEGNAFRGMTAFF